MTIYEAIKIKALHSVLKPDTEYYIRRVARWYSKTYHTPLMEVYSLPLEYLLLEFYEDKYENMEEEDRHLELEEAIETQEQRKERLALEDLDKLNEYELLRISEEENKKKKKLPKEKPTFNTFDLKELPKAISKLNETLKDINDTIKDEMVTDPPEIDMKFESNDEFEKLLNSDSNVNSNKE